MKKYYSPFKPYSKFKRPHILYNFFLNIASLFVRPKVILSEPLPNEPIILMANHAFEYGPFIMMFVAKKIKRKLRTWSSINAATIKNAPNQMMKTSFPNVKKPFSYLARIISFIVGPILALIFRAAGIIPVYRDMRIKSTYTKTFETIKENYDVLIFPDSITSDPDNPYLTKVQEGAFKTFEMCNRFLPTIPKLYPVYCCKSLNTVCIGSPISYDLELPPAEAQKKIAQDLSAAIKKLGESLPPHKIISQGPTPKDYNNIKKYLTYNEEKIYSVFKNNEDEEKIKT